LIGQTPRSGSAPTVTTWGPIFPARPIDEIRRFLADWTKRIDAQYCMVSLPPDFAFPALTDTAHLIGHAILPHCREHGQAFALMIGVKRLVNPQLRLAGDSVGRADISAVENLCAQFPTTNSSAPCSRAKTSTSFACRAQVPQPAHLRLLVVPEQPVARRGDHADATRTDRLECDSATQRLPRARSARL
jgi:hypothetical protein